MPVRPAILELFFFSPVLFLPMLVNRVADFNQPNPVFRHFQNIRRGKIFSRVLG